MLHSAWVYSIGLSVQTLLGLSLVLLLPPPRYRAEPSGRTRRVLMTFSWQSLIRASFWLAPNKKGGGKLTGSVTVFREGKP